MRRDKAALEIFEQSKRMNKRNPNRQLVDKWEPKRRIKHKSILHHVNEIKDNYRLPTNRQEIFRISKSLQPHTNYITPEIKLTLIGNITKEADQYVITDTSLRTIYYKETPYSKRIHSHHMLSMSNMIADEKAEKQTGNNRDAMFKKRRWSDQKRPN
jgi:hypothetical protein